LYTYLLVDGRCGDDGGDEGLGDELRFRKVVELSSFIVAVNVSTDAGAVATSDGDGTFFLFSESKEKSLKLLNLIRVG
jgi:hypothetical protein